MTANLVTGIGELVTNDETLHGADHADGLGLLRNCAIAVEDGKVVWLGAATKAPAADNRIDLDGRAAIPGFVDSHSHLVFAGDRSAEFAARMTGIPYDGGGIAVSVNATRAASDDELRTLVARRVAEMRAQGTTTVEIKSGYGLSVEDEARALRIAGEFTDETTFLGAHVVPADMPAIATTTWTWSRDRCCRLAPLTRAGSMSSVSRTARTHLPRMRHARSWLRAGTPV